MMGKMGETKAFSGLKGLFAVCFTLTAVCIVSIYYPVFGTALMLALIGYLCCRFENIPRFALLLFGLSFVIHALAVACITTPVVSDFKLQYEAAQKFSAGDFSFQESKYFQSWGYQTGLVIYQGFFLKIWNSAGFLRLINCVVASGTNVLVYLLARELFSGRAARCISIAYALFLYPATLVTVLCNSIPSAFFLYLGLYLIVRKDHGAAPRLVIYSIAGALLSVGNALRPDAPVVLIPLAVYFIFRLIQRLSLENFLYYIKRCLALFLTFALLSAGMSALVRATGVNGAGLGNNDPLWGVVVGTNHKYMGIYNNEDGPAINEKMSQGLERNQAAAQVIGEHLRTTPTTLIQLVTDKIQTFWWDRSLAVSMSSIRENYPRLYEKLEALDGAMFACIMAMCILGALTLFFKKKSSFKAYIFPFIIFAAFAVYLVLEVQPRYAYTVQIAVFVLAAGGVEEIFDLWYRARARLASEPDK